MRVLVTGNRGYIGSVLTPILQHEGHEVVGLDTSYYLDRLYPDTGDVPTIQKDMRDVVADDLRGFDAVIAMAELSNDPLGELVGPVTHDVNFKGSVNVAEAAKAAGVKKFVYMSSCSVYGVADEVAHEKSPVNPQTAYAECKLLVEDRLWSLGDENFTVTALRNATVYGPSPSQRFDIVLNNLAGTAWIEDRIVMTSDGEPWRPMAHVKDICRGIVAVLNAPHESVGNEIFNVGGHNVKVRDIAETVAEVFDVSEFSLGSNDGDNRSYQVDFSKISGKLGFEPENTLEDGARDMLSVFTMFGLSSSQFHGQSHVRLKRIENLLRLGLIESDLRWTPNAQA